MTTSTSVSTQHLRTICLVVIALGVLAAGFTLLQRVRTESESRAVDLVLDYNELLGLAGQVGVPPLDVLQELHHTDGNAGATAIALQEETLNLLERSGTVNIESLPTIAPGHQPCDWTAEVPVFAVETRDPAMTDFLQAGLARSYAPGNVIVDSPLRLLIRGNRELVGELGLGLAPDKVALIQSAGLRVIPRLRGGAGVTLPGLQKSLDVLRETLQAPRVVGQRAALARLRTLPTAKGPVTSPAVVVPPTPSAEIPRMKTNTVIVFDGDTIPGFHPGEDDLIKDVADDLTAHHFVYGAIEFAKQKGDDELGRVLQGNLVRVHSISLTELGTLTTSQVVQRYALAVKDRNIRVLFVHLPPVTTRDPRQNAHDFVGAIAKELTKEGFVLSPVKGAHPFKPLSVPRPLLALLFAGAGASVLLWVFIILPTQLPAAWVRIGSIFLVIGLLGAVGSALVAAGPGRMLFGILAAIGFPMLAMTYAYRAVDRLAVQRPASAALQSIWALLVTCGITTLGGFLVAAMLSETHYLVKVGQFAGVKFALAAPLVLFAVLIVAEGVALPGEELGTYSTRVKERLGKFLAQPLYLWAVIVSLAALVVVGLVLIRSGNEGVVGVSTSELRFRAILEQFLIARPRTKEFLFGHPLFLCAMAAATRGKRPLALALLLGGAIGQTDVLNTYCHAHTPVMLSLLRTVNGLWLGVLFGAVLMLCYGYFAARAERARTV